MGREDERIIQCQQKIIYIYCSPEYKRVMTEQGKEFNCSNFNSNLSNCTRYAFANPKCDNYLNIIYNNCWDAKKWIPDCEFYEMNKNLAKKNGLKNLIGLNEIKIKNIASLDEHIKVMKYLNDLDSKYWNKKEPGGSSFRVDKLGLSTHKITEC